MAKKKSKDGAETGQRPWRDVSTFAGGPGRKWTGIASGLLIALVVGGSALYLVLPHDAPAAPSAAPSSSSTKAGEGASADSVCPKVSVDEKAIASPSDLEWTAAYGTSWPVSDSVGPRETVDDVAQCFDRSPVGAAFAAISFVTAVRVADIDDAHRIMNAVYLPGEGRDAALADIDDTYPDQPPQNRQWGRAKGYKVLSFTPDEARVLLVENWPQRGQYTGLTVTLQWSDGDWKVALDSSGQLSPTAPITVDPDNFTPWEKPE